MFEPGWNRLYHFVYVENLKFLNLYYNMALGISKQSIDFA